MKIRKYITLGSTLILGWIVLLACEKKFDYKITQNTELSNKAAIKVYNGTISSLRTYVYADGVPLTGAVIPYAGIFPSTGYTAMIDPGSRTLTIRDTLTTSPQAPINIAANF